MGFSYLFKETTYHIKNHSLSLNDPLCSFSGIQIATLYCKIIVTFPTLNDVFFQAPMLRNRIKASMLLNQIEETSEEKIQIFLSRALRSQLRRVIPQI